MQALGSSFLSLCSLFPHLLLKQSDHTETQYNLLKWPLLKCEALEVDEEGQRLGLCR